MLDVQISDHPSLPFFDARKPHPSLKEFRPFPIVREEALYDARGDGEEQSGRRPNTTGLIGPDCKALNRRGLVQGASRINARLDPEDRNKRHCGVFHERSHP